LSLSLEEEKGVVGFKLYKLKPQTSSKELKKSLCWDKMGRVITLKLNKKSSQSMKTRKLSQKLRRGNGYRLENLLEKVI
jgi:hypothetical protein